MFDGRKVEVETDWSGAGYVVPGPPVALAVIDISAAYANFGTGRMSGDKIKVASTHPKGDVIKVRSRYVVGPFEAWPSSTSGAIPDMIVPVRDEDLKDPQRILAIVAALTRAPKARSK